MAQFDQNFFFGQSASVEAHIPDGSLKPGEPADRPFANPQQGAANVSPAKAFAPVSLRGYPPGLGLSQIHNPA